MHGLFSSCSDTLLEGDDQRGLVQVVQVVQVIFKWFSKLLSVLKKSGCLSEDESVASCEELTTYAVDARAPSFSEKNAEDIPDIVEYLLVDYSFLSRGHLLRVFKICCLVVVSVGNCIQLFHSNWVDVQLLQLCYRPALRGVQSYVALL